MDDLRMTTQGENTETSLQDVEGYEFLIRIHLPTKSKVAKFPGMIYFCRSYYCPRTANAEDPGCRTITTLSSLCPSNKASFLS